MLRGLRLASKQRVIPLLRTVLLHDAVGRRRREHLPNETRERHKPGNDFGCVGRILRELPVRLGQPVMQ